MCVLHCLFDVCACRSLSHKSQCWEGGRGEGGGAESAQEAITWMKGDAQVDTRAGVCCTFVDKTFMLNLNLKF